MLNKDSIKLVVCLEEPTTELFLFVCFMCDIIYACMYGICTFV